MNFKSEQREQLIFVEAAARRARGRDGYPLGEHAHLMPSGTNGISIAPLPMA
jgi:hypothetical protein